MLLYTLKPVAYIIYVFIYIIYEKSKTNARSYDVAEKQNWIIDFFFFESTSTRRRNKYTTHTHTHEFLRPVVKEKMSREKRTKNGKANKTEDGGK